MEAFKQLWTHRARGVTPPALVRTKILQLKTMGTNKQYFSIET